MLLITDTFGRIKHVSGSVENWSGFSVAESVGSKPGDLWGGNMDKDFYRSLWRSISVEHKPFAARVANRSKRGETLPSLLTILPLVDEGGPRYFLAMQPDPDAWSSYEREFALHWERIARDPRVLSSWIERWTGERIDTQHDESVMGLVERTLVQPTSERFANRESDRVSIELARENLEQYADIFKRYYATVLGYLRRRLTDAEEAEDIAQNVFIKAMNGLSRYQTRNASYKTFLLRIAHNELLNQYRRKSVEQRWIAELWTPPDASMRKVETQDALERAMDKLGTADRDTLKLFYGEGRTVADIAVRLGKSENAVKLMLSRSRKRLRGEL